MDQIDDNTIPWTTAPAEVHVTGSEEETRQVAAHFSERLKPGVWIGLIGTLGAGKSVFARGIGRACGVTEAMPSPSYTLMNNHQGRCAIHHIDLYRIGSIDELDFAGLTPYFQGSGICLVEWAEKARAWWPPSGWVVSIEAEGEDQRRISIREFRTSD